MKARLPERKIRFLHSVFTCAACVKFFSIIFSFLLLNQTLLAQQVAVKGKVTSGDSVLAGKTVAVKNGRARTQTDAKGVYSIRAASNTTLTFTSVNFISQDLKVASQSVIDIQLEAANQQLNDVVVVGYGTQKRGSITGAVSSIKSDDLICTPSSTTSGALVGKIQSIPARQTTGQPGASTTIEILSQPVSLSITIPAAIAGDSFIYARIGVKTTGVAELLYTMPVKIMLK